MSHCLRQTCFATAPLLDAAAEAVPRPARRSHRAARAAAVLLALATWVLPAAEASPLSDETRLFLDRQPLGLPGEVEIEVGEPDPRLTLAPCQRLEPFIPSGARMWGRTTLGVRCVQGATWSVYLPVQIKVFGPAAVAARPIARGQAVTSEDLRLDRVEWSLWPAGALAGPDQIEGRLATRNIPAGEPLRRDSLRAAPVVLPGDAVKVVLTGERFAIATEGRSLTTGTDGQSVQVTLAGGKVVTGIARPGHLVELR